MDTYNLTGDNMLRIELHIIDLEQHQLYHINFSSLGLIQKGLKTPPIGSG